MRCKIKGKLTNWEKRELSKWFKDILQGYNIEYVLIS